MLIFVLFEIEEFLPKQWPGEVNTSHWDLINLNERIRICR